MDNQEKLDQLFKFAREEKPHVSFDETKAKFNATVNSSTFGERIKYLLTFKNFLIMLTSIISIAVFFMFSVSSTSEVQSEENNIQEHEHKNKSESVKNQVKSKKKTNQVVQNDITEIQDKESSESKVKRVKKRNNKITYLDYQKAVNLFETHPNDLLIKKGASSSSIPVLSKDQIKNNEKQKAKMLKALAKLKSEDYIYFPSGNMIYEGETKSFQSFLIQTTEVSNLEYRTFLNDLIIQGRNEEYEIAKDNSAKWVELYGENILYTSTMKSKNNWNDTISKNLHFMSNYFNHPAYNNYPVCNISRAGAELYCIWLTKELQKFNKQPKDYKHSSKYKYVRLPLKSEWCYAASSGKDNQVYPWGTDSITNSKGEFLANKKSIPKLDSINSKPTNYTENSKSLTGVFLNNIVTGLPQNIHQFKQTSYGIYNLSGNIAEMVYENYNSKEKYGTAGGSWESNAEEIKIFGPDPYAGISSPHPAIGFRVVISFFDPN